MIALALAVANWLQPEGDVRRLEDPDPAVRDAAMAHLQELGEAARQAVAAGADSPNPEVAERCRILLRWLDERARARHVVEGAPRITLAVPEDRPERVADLLRRFAEHFGIPILGDVPADAVWHGTLERTTALGAVDAVCGPIGYISDPKPDGIHVMQGEPWAGPRAYPGPFRVVLRGVGANRHTDFRGSTMTLQFTFALAHERAAVALGPHNIRLSRAVLRNGDETLEVPAEALGAQPFQLPWGDAQPGDPELRTRSVANAYRIERLEGVIAIQVPITFEEWAFDRLEIGSATLVMGRPATIVRLDTGPSSQGWKYWTAAVQIDLGERRENQTALSGRIEALLLDPRGNAPRQDPDAPPLVESELSNFPSLFRADWLIPADFEPARMVLRVPLEVQDVEVPFVFENVPIP